MTTSELVKLAVKTLDEKKAKDIEVLNVTQLSTLADYFIIASGSNYTQVKALTDEVDAAFTKAGHEPKHIERDTSSNWILLDYGDIIIHVFYTTARDFYNLIGIWGDAPKYSAEQILNP